jgi:hypothetical protein
MVFVNSHTAPLYAPFGRAFAVKPNILLSCHTDVSSHPSTAHKQLKVLQGRQAARRLQSSGCDRITRKKEVLQGFGIAALLRRLLQRTTKTEPSDRPI